MTVLASPRPKPIRGAVPDRSHPLMRGLVGWWPFWEGTGGTLADVSGGLDGTLNNNVAWSAGRSGHALDFPSPAYVSLGLTPNATAQVGTISVWISTTQGGSSHFIWYGAAETGGDGYGGQAESHLELADGAIRFNINNIKNEIDLTGTKTVNDGLWHHIVVTWDNGEAHIYVDGVLDASQTGRETLTYAFDAVHNLGRPDADTRYYDGLLEDVRLFSRALSADEIRQLYLDPWAPFRRSRVSRFFVAASGAVQRDAQGAYSWSASARADRVAPASWTARLTRDRQLPAGWLSALEADRAVAGSWLALAVAEKPAALSWLAAVRADRTLPASWTGEAQVTADAQLALAWLARVERDAAASIEWLRAIASDRAAPVSWAGRVTGVGQIAAAWMGRALTDAELPASWSRRIEADRRAIASWAARVSGDRIAAASWSAALERLGVIPVAWTGSELKPAGIWILDPADNVWVLTGRGTVWLIDPQANTWNLRR